MSAGVTIDWVAELKTILGAGTTTTGGAQPQQERRPTKKAVRLLLSNLGEGAGNAVPSTGAQRQRSDEVVSKAVELLIADKTATTKKKKTRRQALKKFEKLLKTEFASETKKSGLDPAWERDIQRAIDSLRYEEMEQEYKRGEIPPEEIFDQQVLQARPLLKHELFNAIDPTTLSDDSKKKLWLDWVEKSCYEGSVPADSFGTAGGKMLLAAQPALRGAVVAATNPANLDDTLRSFGKDEKVVTAEVLLAMAERDASAKNVIDPDVFTKLKKRFPASEWNDDKGLGPRVCQALWESGNYDQIKELVEYGVDTSLATRISADEMDLRKYKKHKKAGMGVYSGFVQPVEHIVQKHLRDVDLLATDASKLTDDVRKRQAEGAKKILKAVEDQAKKNNEKTKIVTQWSEVTGSPMIAAFRRNPGTIWGFEDIRLPFVQAAHGVDEVPAQPLRMFELWETVEPLLPKYDQLLKDPVGTADHFIAKGVETIEKGVKAGLPKYAEIAKNKDEYIKQFKAKAKAFLIEFSKQMPKTSLAADAEKSPGRSPIALSDIAGIEKGKFASAMACKAGLWWAKEEGKPLYYCLDGIKMADVFNYKKVKNDAIKDFITAGGAAHDAVITMVEMREILKNWDDLQGTVKFVLKGQILTGDELQKRMTEWQKKLKEGNDRAGRRPAPPRKDFAKDLDAIDPGLMAELNQQQQDADLDARDIVKKFRYLKNVSGTRPQILLQYIMSRCLLLTTHPKAHPIVSPGLVQAAAQVNALPQNSDVSLVNPVKAELQKQIGLCHAQLQGPFTKALMNHPKLYWKLPGQR
jgi:hypothetical protein